MLLMHKTGAKRRGLATHGACPQYSETHNSETHSETQNIVSQNSEVKFYASDVVERFPVTGETMKSRRFSTAFGGKGANQAVQCAKLGAKVAMVGKLGKDAFRQEYLKNFDECGVDRNHVMTVDDSPTGTATVVVSEGSGENFIIVNSGANAKLTMDDVDSCKNMIKNSKVVVCQLEVTATVVRRAFEIAKKFG
uniref:Carbohydrate kinase PfkB domain-containing protein n=1 Tax=Romanomermis culicivorax TaxID=13658 RepID=A0A915JHX8_ROMCU